MLDVIAIAVLVIAYGGIAVLGARNLWRSRMHRSAVTGRSAPAGLRPGTEAGHLPERQLRGSPLW